MKKNILIIAGTLIFSLTTTVIFAQENKKASEARKDIVDAQKDLKEAKSDSIEDYTKFNKEARIRIADNKVKIAELKAKKASSNKDDKEKYDKKVLALEQKNNDLQTKIDGAGVEKTSMWPSFKREFSHDLEELGRAFKDIGVNNAK